MVANLSSGRREFFERMTCRPVHEVRESSYQSELKMLTKAERRGRAKVSESLGAHRLENLIGSLKQAPFLTVGPRSGGESLPPPRRSSVRWSPRLETTDRGNVLPSCPRPYRACPSLWRCRRLRRQVRWEEHRPADWPRCTGRPPSPRPPGRFGKPTDSAPWNSGCLSAESRQLLSVRSTTAVSPANPVGSHRGR